MNIYFFFFKYIFKVSGAELLTPVLLLSVGNKNDDPARKQVDTHDAMRFGESVGVRVFETSAKENINVEEVTSRLPVCRTFIYKPIKSFLYKASFRLYPVCRGRVVKLF